MVKPHKAWRFRWAGLVAAGLSVWWLAPLRAQDQPDISNKPLQPQLVNATTGEVRLIVEVVNSKGQGVYDLGAANFEVAVEGLAIRQATLGRAADPQHALSVILALDVSGSMKGAGIAAAKAAALDFIERLRKEDSCALLLFGEGVRQAADFTRNRQLLRQQVEGIEAADRKTYLYQALYEALDRAVHTPSSRTALVVLTDGRDDGSGLGVEDVVAKVPAARVPIYALGFGPKADEKLLRRVATLSRGAYYYAPDAEGLTRLYAAVAEELSKSNQYLLTFRVGRFAGERTVTVHVKHRGQTAKATGKLVGPPPPPPPWLIAAIVGGALIVALAIWLGFRWYRRAHPGIVETVAMQPASLPAGWLEVTRGPHAGQRYPLRDGTETVVGRVAKRSHLCLKQDPLVSARHFKITQNDLGQFVIEDLESRNKTRVNEVELSEPLVLQSNDKIQIGLSELLFVDNR